MRVHSPDACGTTRALTHPIKARKVVSWLKYFENVDACFCYACRMFAKDSAEGKTFTKTGFSDRKTGLENDRGFNKHQNSEVHIRAMAFRKKREYWEKRGQTVQNQILLNLVEGICELNVEFDRRFSKFISVMWKSYEILKPCNDLFLQAQELVPLLDCIKTIPAACHKVTYLSFERSVLKEFSIEQVN